MAQAFLNPVFTGISGKVGGLVLYEWNGRTLMRRYVVPRNPDTPAQRANRDLFREAMRSWQALADSEKAAYNRRAARLAMTGHNLFISRYMRIHAPAQPELPARRGNPAAAPGFYAHIYPAHGRTLSVAAPSPARFAVLSTPARPDSPPG